MNHDTLIIDLIGHIFYCYVPNHKIDLSISQYLMSHFHQFTLCICVYMYTHVTWGAFCKPSLIKLLLSNMEEETGVKPEQTSPGPVRPDTCNWPRSAASPAGSGCGCCSQPLAPESGRWWPRPAGRWGGPGPKARSSSLWRGPTGTSPSTSKAPPAPEAADAHTQRRGSTADGAILFQTNETGKCPKLDQSLKCVVEITAASGRGGCWVKRYVGVTARTWEVKNPPRKAPTLIGQTAIDASHWFTGCLGNDQAPLHH